MIMSQRERKKKIYWKKYEELEEAQKEALELQIEIDQLKQND